MTNNNITLETITKKAQSIGKRGKTLQQDIHEVSLDALRFAMENDCDATGFNRVYSNLPVSIRRASYKAWVEAFAPIRFVTKKSKTGATIKVFQKSKSDNAPKFNLQGATDTPFWEFEAQKGDNEADPLTVEDFQKQIARYLKTQRTKNEGNDAVISLIDTIESRAGIVEAA